VPKHQAFAERLRKAVRLFESEAGDLDQAELGRLVAQREGRKQPYRQPSVSLWFKGSVPEVPALMALASVLGVRAGWLLFGEEPRDALPVLPANAEEFSGIVAEAARRQRRH
jgi:hypothetical protein